MPLTKLFNKKALAALLATTALVAAGCGGQTIGAPGEKADLEGTVATETLPESGASVQRVHLSGDQLEAGKSYTIEGESLTIDGDVPAGTKITGNGGQILITGDVGDKAQLTANVPEYTHIEEHTCSSFIMVGKVMVPTTYSCDQTIDDGPKPPFDQDPAIIVKGKVGKDVKLSSSYNTTISAPKVG